MVRVFCLLCVPSICVLVCFCVCIYCTLHVACCLLCAVFVCCLRSLVCDYKYYYFCLSIFLPFATLIAASPSCTHQSSSMLTGGFVSSSSLLSLSPLPSSSTDPSSLKSPLHNLQQRLQNAEKRALLLAPRDGVRVYLWEKSRPSTHQSDKN